jgi:hypothetical protein
MSSYIVLMLERHVAELGRKKARRRNDPRRTSFCEPLLPRNSGFMAARQAVQVTPPDSARDCCHQRLSIRTVRRKLRHRLWAGRLGRYTLRYRVTFKLSLQISTNRAARHAFAAQ